MTRLLTIGLLLLSAASGPAAWGAEVFRWIDDDGRTQIADQPPAQGARNVTRTPLEKQDVSPADQRAAQERAARDRAAVKRFEDERRATAQARKPRAAGSSEKEEAGLPPRGSAEDCRNWRVEYANSQACFAPYRNARGGIKAEAFKVCGPEVLDPAPECGAGRN